MTDLLRARMLGAVLLVPLAVAALLAACEEAPPVVIGDCGYVGDSGCCIDYPAPNVERRWPARLTEDGWLCLAVDAPTERTREFKKQHPPPEPELVCYETAVVDGDEIPVRLRSGAWCERASLNGVVEDSDKPAVAP